MILALGEKKDWEGLCSGLEQIHYEDSVGEVHQWLSLQEPKPMVVLGTSEQALLSLKVATDDATLVLVGEPVPQQEGMLHCPAHGPLVRQLVGLLLREHRTREENQRLQLNIEMVELYNEHLVGLQKQSRNDLEQARVAQELLLPHTLELSDKFTFMAEFRPMDEVGGDFYDVVRLNEEMIGVVVADVTGHGLSASMIAMLLRLTFQQVGKRFSSPKEAVSAVNDILNEYMPPGRFASLFYLVLNENTYEMSFTCAGHPPAFLIPAEQEEVVCLTTDGMVVGVLPSDIANYEERVVQLSPGDRVFVYTDALFETNQIHNQKLEFFGEERLRQTILQVKDLPMKEMMRRVLQTVLQFSGKDRFDDDATLLGIEVKPFDFEIYA